MVVSGSVTALDFRKEVLVEIDRRVSVNRIGLDSAAIDRLCGKINLS